MKTRLTILKRFKKYSLMVKGPIIGLILCSIVALPVSFISPKMFQILIDDVICEGKTDEFTKVVTGLFSVYFIKLLTDGLKLFFRNKVTNSFTYNIRKDIIKKFGVTEFSFLEKKAPGELKLRVLDDVGKVSSFIQNQIVNYFCSIIMSVTALILLLKINVKMTLCSILIIPFVFIINNIIGNRIKKTNEEIRTAKSEYTTSTHNSLQFWREIKIQNAENLFVKRFKEYRERLARLGMKYIRLWACREVFKDFKSNYLTKIIVYIIGSFFVLNNSLTIGALIMFSKYYAQFFSSIESVNNKGIDLKINSPYYERIFDTLDFPEEKNNLSIVELSDKIELKNVSFSYYKQQKHVLKNISFKINYGDYVAIVGQTGCGKSTLIKLILGLYKEYTGEIFIDGVERRSVSDSDFFKKVGVVMQDNYLFNMTIRENLLMYNENAKDEDIYDACKKASIFDFVTSLPDGFDTLIGERGVKLSGGQKQRLSIAAALLKKPRLIIFDEATSSLDKESEKIINDSINEISKYVTVIAITHRPSTALNAKKIIVIKDGEVSALGDHKHLLESNDYYKKMMEAAI